jgi:DNA-binding transcriptional LysR family regulator
MPSRLPPLNPLRAFEAAARRGSISAAARELSVTHGAISHQIRSLEETLKTALFERGGKRLKLTPQGALLLPAVTQAFDGIAAATALMNRPSTSGSLRISCVPALLSLWLVPRLGSFVDRYPEISLTLTSSNDSNLIYSPDIDIAILYGPGGWKDCWTRLCGRCAPYAICTTMCFYMATMDANGEAGSPPPISSTCRRRANTSWAMQGSRQRLPVSARAWRSGIASRHQA